MQNDILFFAEQRNGQLQKINRELAGGAKRLASETGGRAIALLAGSDTRELAERLLAAGADQVLTADSLLLANYSSALYAEVMAQAALKVNPFLILLGSTTIGMDLAPALAVKLNAGLVTDCTGLWLDTRDNPDETSLTEKVRMMRPNLDGITTDTMYCPDGTPVIATLRPGVLTPLTEEEALQFLPPSSGAPNRPDRSDAVCALTLSETALKAAGQVELLEIEQGARKADDITEARVLAAGGRGVGGPEGFRPLRRIAELLGGTIACSRACIESGWVDTAYQVGQTGKTVRPDLYLACGISGAFQHTTGMEGSKLIISINKNPAAPIFDISDLGIVGNVEIILPQLIQALEAYQK